MSEGILRLPDSASGTKSFDSLLRDRSRLELLQEEGEKCQLFFFFYQ